MKHEGSIGDNSSETLLKRSHPSRLFITRASRKEGGGAADPSFCPDMALKPLKNGLFLGSVPKVLCAHRGCAGSIFAHLFVIMAVIFAHLFGIHGARFAHFFGTALVDIGEI